MFAKSRLILGGATLSACGLICTVVALADQYGTPASVLWTLLTSISFIVALGLLSAHCVALTRRDQRRRVRMELKLAESAVVVRELQLQLKLADAERRHAETIVDNISDSILVTDPTNEMSQASSLPAQTFKSDTSDGGFQSIDAALADPGMIALIRQLGETHNPEARKVVERKVSTVAGERIFRVALSSIAPPDAPGGVIAICRDVTDEKEISEVKNDFVSMVSHELRTPLACIKAYVEMLIDGEAEDPKTQHEFYEVIQNEANRLGRLIDNILCISRIEAGLITSDKQPLDLGAIIKDAIEVIRPQTVEKSISLTTNVGNAPYRTLVDRDLMFQAVLNLLSNAVKYTPDGRSISVEVGVDPDRKRVSTKIIDTGVGIPPKDMPYVFDKFYRAEANSRIAPGTGLGLALVRHIIETVHDGRMFAQSCVGQGSCFGFELDLRE